MKRHIFSLAKFCLSIAALFLYTCINSGTLSEENTGTVTGFVVYSDLQPVQNATVKIHRIVNFQEDSLISITTDSNGFFSVELLNLGDYIVEAIQTYTGDLKRIVLRSSEAPVFIGLKLQPLGMLRGSIDTLVSRLTSGQTTVVLPEINRSVTVSEQGIFEISTLAAATYKALVISGKDTILSTSGDKWNIPIVSRKNTFFTLRDGPVVSDDTTENYVTGSLSCSKLEPTRISLFWKSPGNINSVQLFRHYLGSNNDLLLTTATDSMFIDSMLAPQTTYHYYTVMTGNTTNYKYRSAEITVTTPASDNSNRLPTITINTPAHDTAVLLGSELLIAAEVFDLDGSIREVRFFIDSTLLQAVAATPYHLSWHASLTKRYSLVVAAVDNTNDTAWSAPINLYGDTQLLGDVNSDGFITPIDADLIANYSVNLIPEKFNVTAADLDGNGIINTVDALIVAQLSEGIISLAPVYKTFK